MPENDNAVSPENLAAEVAQRSGANGAIILASFPDGSVSLLAHGLNNSRANEMLSIGIYVNLTQHYDNIKNGHVNQEGAIQ